MSSGREEGTDEKNGDVVEGSTADIPQEAEEVPKDDPEEEDLQDSS